MLAVAVGLYLPFELSVPVVLGGMVARMTRRAGHAAPRRGILAAAGLITGEALTGLLLAAVVASGGQSFRIDHFADAFGVHELLEPQAYQPGRLLR